MDIKSKKSSKSAKVIIALTVLLPALLFVSLYPRMERLMLEKREEYTLAGEESADYNQSDVLAYNFVNYAVESAYYIYGRFLQDAEKREVNLDVLDRFGWINDYYSLSNEVEYYAVCDSAAGGYSGGNSQYNLQNLLMEKEQQSKAESALKQEGFSSYLVLEFDAYGKMAAIEFVSLGNLRYEENLYQRARESVEQYQNNLAYYKELAADAGLDAEWAEKAGEVVPKNFRAVFAIPENSMFIEKNSFMFQGSIYPVYFSIETIYWDMGGIIVLAILAAIVAVIALVLPFFKKLNTGWEKLFCMPLEIVICLFAVAFLGAWIMYETMCFSTYTEVERIWNSGEILGYPISNATVYGILLWINVLGWAFCFFMEYTIVASVRQFFCNPLGYLKNRLLGIMFLRWIYRQCKRFVRFMTKIELSQKMHGSIVKIVVLNGVLIALMCCGWFVGIAAVLVYSIVLYFVLRKKGEEVQGQYDSILQATEQMAQGELKISLKEDLGIFEPLGTKLTQVQEGFSKAVAEEAKSQKMKTELISNVSHDLKTPLTAIITYVGLLKQEGNTAQQQRNYIQTLDVKSQRLKVLIEDLFEVSKAQSGNIQLNRMDVDVVSLMKQLRLEMEDKIAESDLAFRWNLPEEKVILFLDGQKTYRIFENLLSNAIKYAMPQSRVYIDLVNDEDEVQIVFRNISAQEIVEDAQRLTDRFVRGDVSRNSEGSGLGLAIVKSFTEIQGGTFKIDTDGDLFKAVLCCKKQVCE